MTDLQVCARVHCLERQQVGPQVLQEPFLLGGLQVGLLRDGPVKACEPLLVDASCVQRVPVDGYVL